MAAALILEDIDWDTDIYEETPTVQSIQPTSNFLSTIYSSTLIIQDQHRILIVPLTKPFLLRLHLKNCVVVVMSTISPLLPKEKLLMNVRCNHVCKDKSSCKHLWFALVSFNANTELRNF